MSIVTIKQTINDGLEKVEAVLLRTTVDKNGKITDLSSPYSPTERKNYKGNDSKTLYAWNYKYVYTKSRV